MNLPQPFIQTIHHTFGDRGRLFLDSLPDLLDEACRRWNLTAVVPLANLSYNFVAFARRGGNDVVLKLGVPDSELTSGLTALRLFEGRRSVRLLESDAARGMCLLERLKPGELLAALTDDDRATHIAADVMLALWRPLDSHPDLIQFSSWFKGLEGLHRRFQGGTGPLAPDLVSRAESSVRDFLAEGPMPTLIHGDLHHFNILSSERGWLAIDPKGVIGPAAYEVGPFLLNPWRLSGHQPVSPALMERRISILSERLGFEGQRIREWGIAHAVLSAWWSIEGQEDWQPAMECASILARAPG